MSVVHNSDHEISIRIVDQQNQNYQMSNKQPFPEDKHIVQQQITDQKLYQFEYKEDPFSFNVKRSKNSSQSFFDSSGDQLIFSDNLVGIGTKYEDHYGVFGFADHNGPFRLLKRQNYTAWNTFEDMNLNNNSFMAGSSSQNAVLLKNYDHLENYIILFRSSSPLNLKLEGHNKLYYKMLDGIIDIKIFMHQNLNRLLGIYSNSIGKHVVPPFWSMGYLYGDHYLNTQEQLEKRIRKFRKMEIPIDGVFVYNLGMSYPDKVFEIKEQFDNEVWIQMLKKYSLKSIVSILPGIHVDPFIDEQQQRLYDSLIDGYKQNVFLKDIYREQQVDAIHKYLDNRIIHIIDYTHPNATRYWDKQLNRLRNQHYYDGIFLISNQVLLDYPGNFNLTKQLASTIDFIHYNQKCKEQIKQEYPFMPISICLSYKTIDTEQIYYNGNRHLNIHNIYNLLQSYSTYIALQNMKISLPFVLSESSGINSHQYGFQQIGNHRARWKDLKLSVDKVLRQSFHGIQMVGQSICGLFQDMDDELCARWYQLAAIYPSAIAMKPEKDYLDVSQVGKSTRLSIHRNIKLRYSLLRYLYLQMLNYDKKGFIWKHFSLFFDQDPKIRDGHLTDHMNHQIMIGNNLLATPILNQYRVTRNIYMPHDHMFFDFHTGQSIHMDYNQTLHYVHSNAHSLDTYIKTHKIINHCYEPIPLFIRAGRIIQVQNTAAIKNSQDLGFQIILKVGLDLRNNSKGELILLADLYNDHDVSQYCVHKDCLTKVRFTITKQNQLYLKLEVKDYQLYNDLALADKLVDITGLHIYYHYDNKQTMVTVCQQILITDPQYQTVPKLNATQCQQNRLVKKQEIYRIQNQMHFDHLQLLSQIQQQM